MVQALSFTPHKPETLSGYLELLSRPVFSIGMSWRVVDAKWPGIVEAFEGFEPERVAAYGDDAIERLLQDPRIIRNRKKVEAIVDNAQTLIDLDREQDGFEACLDSLGSFDDTVKGLRREFRFLGEMGAYLFLWAIERPVPSHDEWMKTHPVRGGSARPHGRRSPAGT
jgi:DNA-3-methyladenine glycosylase I